MRRNAATIMRYRDGCAAPLDETARKTFSWEYVTRNRERAGDSDTHFVVFRWRAVPRAACLCGLIVLVRVQRYIYIYIYIYNRRANVILESSGGVSSRIRGAWTAYLRMTMRNTRYAALTNRLIYLPRNVHRNVLV
jgi:hypothetical protein